MTGMRIEIDIEALVHQSWKGMPLWWCDKWRPAKKGKRSVPPLLPYQRGFPSAGESLREKLEKGVASTRKGRVG